jgi:hypothetical protein
MERMDEITKILAQQTELLNNLQNELIDIKKTLSKNSQTDCDTDTIEQTANEDTEDRDFTLWIPKDLDKFYSIWITDDKTSYKNPIIVCDDEVDTSYIDGSDIYDIAHNISIFEDKNDAEQYAKHINIDMTIYRLKCYCRDHVSNYDQSNDAIYLGYVTDDNGVDFYYTHNRGKFSRFVKPISSVLYPDMWEWMRPILTKYFGFNIVGEV